MNRQSLETRKIDLQRNIDNSLSNHNGLLGRLAECNYQIEELDKKEAAARLSCAKVEKTKKTKKASSIKAPSIKDAAIKTDKA
jgi:hypothetical protein